jgi:hypothetical protein
MMHLNPQPILFLAALQLTRGGAVAHGRLVIRLVEDDPSSPWLVTFDDQEFQDEEIHDDALGPLVSRADDSDNTASKSGDNKPKTTKKKSLRHKPPLPTRNNSDHKAGSGSEESATPDLKKKKRSPSLDHHHHNHADERNSNADTDASSPIDSGKHNSSKVSDREQRSRRRHQSDADDAPSSTLLKQDHVRPAAPLFHPSKKIKTKGGEEVVKIPMLTGTLYLYRGPKRRVAFIPKI